MSNFFAQTGLGAGDIALRAGGVLSPPVVNAVYPLEALTRLHEAWHIPGLTGRWMDTGSTALGGAVRGSFHRLTHGHHLFEDGFKVLVNPELNFGQFLHHLGMDSLTARGIPNPLLPSAVGQRLVDLGMSQRFVSELLSVSVPKVLGGGLGLVCAGMDVYACFSDAIPHTFMAAGTHFTLGALELGFGLFPPNAFLLLAGAAEMGVAAVTAYRAIVDPVLPVVGVPASLYFPALGQAVLLAALVGACVGYFTGAPGRQIARTMGCAAAASGVATTTAFAVKGGGFLAPFMGPLAGIATFLLANKLLNSFGDGGGRVAYREYEPPRYPAAFRMGSAIACPRVARRPIGMLRGDRLLMDPSAIRDMAGEMSNGKGGRRGEGDGFFGEGR